MPDAPLRIECFDISHVQGTNVVASMVVFEDGLARKSEYRRFAMRETRRRRRLDRRGDPAPVRPVPGETGRRGAERRTTDGRRRPAGPDGRPAADRRSTEDGRPKKFAYPPNLVVVDGGAPAGRGRPGGAGRARHHRRHPGRAGQAAGGGVAARRGPPGDPAAHLRGAVPAAAGPGRGAPVRHHLPPAEAVEVDDRVRAGRHRRAGPGPPQGAAARTSARCSKLRAATSTRSPRCPASGRNWPSGSSRRWPPAPPTASRR